MAENGLAVTLLPKFACNRPIVRARDDGKVNN
jgi:hypothetical protein